MKKKILRWSIRILGALVLFVVVGILFLDTIAKFVAEKRLRAETGMEATIGKFNVGLRSSTIHIQDLVLKNPPEFGVDNFIEMPELFLDYDREALRAGKLRLKLVRINIARVHVVENKDGRKNIDDLQKHQSKPAGGRPDLRRNGTARADEQPFVFGGIETLDVTLKQVQFTSSKSPGQNLDQDIGLKNEIFKNLNTEKDFQTAAALIALKTGAGLLWKGELTNPLTLLLGGAEAGKETKEVLEELAPTVPEKKSKPIP